MTYIGFFGALGKRCHGFRVLRSRAPKSRDSDLRYGFYLFFVFAVYGFEFGMQKEVLPLYGRFMMYPVSLKYTAGPILETL